MDYWGAKGYVGPPFKLLGVGGGGGAGPLPPPSSYALLNIKQFVPNSAISAKGGIIS